MEFIILIILTAIALIICAFIPSDNDSHVIKFISLFLVLCSFACSICIVSYDDGVKDGAYNQLRGKYEVTYIIDKDSCVVDTIINLD